MNERQAQSLDIPLPPLPPPTVEIYVGVGRGFYQFDRHSCASTRRPGVAAEQVLIRVTRSHLPVSLPPLWIYAANVRRIFTKQSKFCFHFQS